MAGALRKTMVYLGLAEDDDRYDDDLDHRGGATEARQYEEERAERADRGERGDRSARPETGAAVTQLPRRPTSVARLVREPEVGPLNRITTIHPRTYNEAKTIGESFRDGTPVIMNLSDMGDADAKRLVDFAAGLVFGLHGTIERVTSKVFLLSPAHVEVASEEPEGAPSARGFFNQS
jgi:cell division inhibitor SepF